ncbi:MAG: GAF domain-containing protein [Chloroflexi bacterium]|nr:MAG: GAF domain-containing protein [Chloroflexota bacterium]
MEEQQTWRDLLGKIISNAQEKQRIAKTLGVNPVTLLRWATNKSNPRQDNLRQLVDTLPGYRQQLIELVAKEYPQIFGDINKSEDIPLEIPSTFYAHVLNAHTTTPAMLRASSVCTLILQQILAHLDPRHLGMLVAIAQCVTPKSDCSVHSLRQTVYRGTYPWNTLNEQVVFYGAESQIGQAISSGHAVVTQSKEEKRRLYPIHFVDEEESSAAFPILIAGRAAGCLYIASTRRDYFSHARLALIQCYTDLMVLAFEERDFYSLDKIELRVMPEPYKQQPHIIGLQQNIIQKMLRSAQEGKAITRPEAELLVWQETEERLLHER